MKLWIVGTLFFSFLIQIKTLNPCEELSDCYCISDSSIINLYCDLSDNVQFNFSVCDLENINHMTLKGRLIRMSSNEYGHVYPLLNTLVMEGNSIETYLTKSFLEQFPHLQTLVIKHCEITGMEKGLFSVITHIRSIDLSGNGKLGFQAATVAFDGFWSTELRYLNLSSIQLSEGLPEGIVPYSLFESLQDTLLEELDISWNRISIIEASFSHIRHLKYFNISGTALHGRSACLSTLIGLKNFTELVGDFWPTSTRGHEIPAYISPRYKHKRSEECIGIPTVSQSGCYHLGTGRTFQMQHSFMATIFIDFSKETCIEPNNIVNLLFAYSSIRRPVNEIYGLRQLEVFDLSYPIYETDALNPAVVITVFKHMPSLRKILIAGNRLNIFSDRLQTLFIHCPELRVIDISSNNLTSLPEDIFKNNTLLKHINISRNSLSVFRLNLSNFNYLHVLDLSFNNFKHLDQAFITNEIWNANSIVLNLMYNHFDCDCSINEVLSMNASDLQISCQKKNNIKIIQRNSSLATSPFFTCKEEGRGFENVLVIVASISGFITVATIFLIVCCYMRRKTKMSNSSHSIGNEPFVHFIRVSEEPRNRRNVVFLAFIAYSHHDREFVCNTLYPRLNSTLRNLMPDHCENSVLTLYDKHFLPGDDIDLACEQAILQSYVTIAIVSQSFLESSWCSYEIKTAMHERIPLIPLYLEQCDPSKLKGIFKNMFNCKVRMEWPTKGTSQDEEERVITRLGQAICANVSAMKQKDEIES